MEESDRAFYVFGISPIKGAYQHLRPEAVPSPSSVRPSGEKPSQKVKSPGPGRFKTSCMVARSQIFTASLPELPVARRWLSAEKARPCTPNKWPRSVPASCHEPVCHNLTK